MLTKCFKIIFCIVISCGFVHPGFASGKLPVFVSIVPQKYFVQQIGGDRVDVRVMVQPGASPATYEPKPRQMAALSGATIYFAIGVAFENTWLKKFAAANPKMKVVHTHRGITRIRMAGHYHQEGAHEKDENHHEPGGLDPHIWLSPPLVKVQARTVTAALQELDPANKEVYAANFKRFAHAIDRLDSDLREIFASKQGMSFMAFHPSWGYFARAYALRQVPIEIEGKNTKPAQLKELIEHARENRIKVVFVQPQFSTRSAALVAREIGGQVAYADPLAEEWIANLRSVAGKFKTAVK